MDNLNSTMKFPSASEFDKAKDDRFSGLINETKDCKLAVAGKVVSVPNMLCSLEAVLGTST